jgi:hypothetical protein
VSRCNFTWTVGVVRFTCDLELGHTGAHRNYLGEGVRANLRRDPALHVNRLPPESTEKKPRDPASLNLDLCPTRALQVETMDGASGDETAGHGATSEAGARAIAERIVFRLADLAGQSELWGDVRRDPDAYRAAVLRELLPALDRCIVEGRRLAYAELVAELEGQLFELSTDRANLADLRARMREVTTLGELAPLLLEGTEIARQHGYMTGHNDRTLSILRSLKARIS